jgi:N-hydroxyarylamine O-acetyltransferase
VNPELVHRYLERIGAGAPVRPTHEALVELTRRHLESVPFENLGIHLGEPASVDENVLFGKIVDQRRGGICYELNGLFAELLRALGYEVDLLMARVWRDTGHGWVFGHSALRVHGPVAPVLVDVGFGNSTVGVVPWEPEAAITGFRLRPGEHADVLLYSGDELLYTVDTRPRELVDFFPMCWFWFNWPGSFFRHKLHCMLAVPGGKRSLSGNRYVETSEDGSTELDVPDDELLACYKEKFGIVLDRPPVLAQTGCLA